MDGKAMVVCMSRRICVELYREIGALRPEWAADKPAISGGRQNWVATRDSGRCVKEVLMSAAKWYQKLRQSGSLNS
jgi:type I site-specific restriction-modification system R (restriction) subunit